MHIQAALAARQLLACAWALIVCLAFALPVARAQDDYSDDYGGGGGGGSDEPSFSVNGMMRMQGGVFAPLLSDKFKPHENIGRIAGRGLCDVRIATTACVPVDHGQDPGTPSIMRATLQLEAQWDINRFIGVHAIVRGVRSGALPADQYARIPVVPENLWNQNARSPQINTGRPLNTIKLAQDTRAIGNYAENWTHDNYYTELDLREMYIDLTPNDWLSMRIGRQQIMWGDIGGFRLLDMINPENDIWHFGALEATEDVRTPLWMWNTTIDIPNIDHSLELLWIPMLDRPRDTVSTPLTFGGAWGVPYSNAPTTFYAPNTVFQYPGHRLKDERAGLRWKGNIGETFNYSLVYLYTHQISSPIPMYGYYALNSPATADLDTGEVSTTANIDSTVLREAVVTYPRQHIAGFSLEQNIAALATVARLESSFETRTFAGRTDLPIADPTDHTRINFVHKQLPVVNYAVQLQRPTMIRFLNPTNNFLLVAQFYHSFLPTLDMDSPEGKQLVNAPTFNKWQLQKHSFRVVALARTSYLHGLISLEVLGCWLPNIYYQDSGFYTVDVGFRIGPHYRLNVRVTDFIGKNPYVDLGLYRDRDEVAANFTVLF